MPHTDWMYSRPPAWRSFFRRLLMCFQETLGTVGGVLLIRSRITETANTLAGVLQQQAADGILRPGEASPAAP